MDSGYVVNIEVFKQYVVAENRSISGETSSTGILDQNSINIFLRNKEKRINHLIYVIIIMASISSIIITIVSRCSNGYNGQEKKYGLTENDDTKKTALF